jgi:hypothetical protein
MQVEDRRPANILLELLAKVKTVNMASSQDMQEEGR